MNGTALILIDIQNDYFPGGKIELEGAEAAARHAARALGHFRRIGSPIFHIRHESVLPGRNFMLPGTHGAEIHPLVAPANGETVITKNYPNAFRETTLLARLKGEDISHLVFAGMMTHMCIDTSVRAAFDHGFACTLLKEATATRALPGDAGTVSAAQVQAAFLAALGQLFARIVGTEPFLVSSAGDGR